ncbi:MAG TPA: tetratricopeptide repeat protein [Stellaceae bacterium]|jgi:tetratricopeptide (TPR) repeat protein|nr:tetratricopeptide repeat protein [Stellaceae bacterium]
MAAAQSRRSIEAYRAAKELYEAGKFAEAEALLAAAITEDRGNADIRNARGVMLAALGRNLDALWCYRDAVALNPNNAGIWTNLGNCLTKLRYLKSAIECHQRAIELAPNDSLLRRNLGVSFAEAGQHGEAVIAYTRALEINPQHHNARWDRARSYLYLGNYREGWKDYEIRRVTGQLPQRKRPGAPWDGRSYAGQRLVLLVEQGFGDTLWAARYLPKVKALGGELLIECQLEVASLIETMGVADQIIPQGQPIPEAEFHCYFCSLPSLFTYDMHSIPSPPYLLTPKPYPKELQDAIATASGRLKVGIVWSGSVTFKRNRDRAQPLLKFFKAFAVPGVQLFSLQKGPRTDELASLPRGSPIIDLAPYLNDFGDTAAAVGALDLIIMTDSAVAHLAGALGRPVWVLLGHVAHWLWLLDRTDNPWYPSVRLFRPRADGDWDHVFDTASVELMRLVRRGS